jgi:hypothetical protein
MTTAQELKQAAYLAGAKDLLRVTESIRYAVQGGRPVKDVLAELKKNQPALFGPERKPETKPGKPKPAAAPPKRPTKRAA